MVGTLARVSDDLRELFAPAPGLAYLDTATYGLAPRPTLDAMTEAMAQWQAGTADWIEDWDRLADRARAAFATLVGVPAIDVAMVPAASVGVGTVAAGLTGQDRVVVPDDEFTSLLYPLLVARDRGAEVCRVPFDGLVDAIDAATTLVATSLVQMHSGRVAPLDALLDRAAEVGARVLVDATHGLPFVGLDGLMARVDYAVCAAYKHLLCPRGVAFLVVREEHHRQLPPWNAGWRAAADPYGQYAGGELVLGEGAARFDVSVPWLSWVGGAVSLDLVASWARAGELAPALGRAEVLADRLGVEWGRASLVCVPVADLAEARAALDRARVRVGFPGTGVRLSTHVYTTDADVDQAVAALEPLVGTGGGGP